MLIALLAVLSVAVALVLVTVILNGASPLSCSSGELVARGRCWVPIEIPSRVPRGRSDRWRRTPERPVSLTRMS
jgi:hypothetical protein